MAKQPHGMFKYGPIIVIEDDEDDQRMMADILKKIDHSSEAIFFSNGYLALDYLHSTTIYPFLILSDINMPKINGLELRNLIMADKKLSVRCIPYLFFTTAASEKSVVEVYSMSVQGFFKKPNTMGELEKTVRTIIDYWTTCLAPGLY